MPRGPRHCVAAAGGGFRDRVRRCIARFAAFVDASSAERSERRWRRRRRIRAGDGNRARGGESCLAARRAALRCAEHAIFAEARELRRAPVLRIGFRGAALTRREGDGAVDVAHLRAVIFRSSRRRLASLALLVYASVPRRPRQAGTRLRKPRALDRAANNSLHLNSGNLAPRGDNGVRCAVRRALVEAEEAIVGLIG